MTSSRGEVSALVGFGGQYQLAARVILARLSTLEWIRVADPEAGVADDFQFQSGGRRYALQVKWSQHPGLFTWSDLTSGEGGKPGLLTSLAAAWQQLRETSTVPLSICVCTNNHASTTSASANTPIGQSHADGSHSLATFLTRSFELVRLKIMQGTTQWSDLAQLPEVVQWSQVWERLRSLTDISDEEFPYFVRDLELKFGLQLDDPLVRSDHDSADDDVAHVAQTLQEIVRDPTQPVELSRQQLMERLGWSGLLRYRHPHQFPVPAGYTTNEAARARVESRLDQLAGGYVALVGPAGCGKSTLLASLNLHGHVVRYYAFVPDAPDPLSSRGEAESFLHDVSLALEDSGLIRGGIGNDLRSQRAVLQKQLDWAGRRWAEHGGKTIIVVDGLDHIPREQSPTRSLIEELPVPTALPDGVFVVLGTQTTRILPHVVQQALDQQDRVAHLPPLSAEEVEQVANAAGVGAWLYPGQLTTLVDASEGHPLALAYMLQELSALEASEPDEDTRRERAGWLLADASEYGGDVAVRYRGYFQAVSGDQQALDLLGRVARLRVPANLDWLSTWADPHAVTAFAERTATFFRRSGADWQFIHNSFRRFLADETMRVAGRLDETRDRQLHQSLADVCANSSDSWNVYRDEEVAHRFLAGQHDRVLELATPERLRRSLLDLRPSATVQDHALLALRSATLIDRPSAFLQMLMFLNELRLRGMVLETEPLATAVRQFDPQLALEHIVRGGHLRITPHAAAEHATTYAASGDIDAAQRILRACGGLPGLTSDRREAPHAVADWAMVVWQLSGLAAVLAEIDHHLPYPSTSASPSTDRDVNSEQPHTIGPHGTQRVPQHVQDRREREAMTIACRNLAHARCFDLLVDARDDEALDALTSIIDGEADASWRARARYMRAVAASEDHARADMLGWIREIVAIDTNSMEHEVDDEEEPIPGATSSVDLAVRLAAAELLIRNGFTDALEIDQLVPLGTAASWPSTVSGQEGLAPFDTLIALGRLRHVRPDPTRLDVLTSPTRSTRDTGNERFRRALHTLAELDGQQLAAEAGVSDPPAIAARAEPIIRLLEVPAHTTHDWTGWYIVRDAAIGLFRRTVAVASESGGSHGLTRLLTLFDEAWTNPERAQYWTPEAQQAVVVAALDARSDAPSWATEWLNSLDATINDRSGDPHDRVSLWLTQTQAWAAAGDLTAARQAAQSAVRASQGIGVSDRDRQLDEWLEWLGAAVDSGNLSIAEFTRTAHAYASRIVSAVGPAPSQARAAAETLIGLVFAKDVSLACEFAEWLCDSGALSQANAVETVVLAACRHAGIPVMYGAAAAAHLLYPIMLEPSRKILDVTHSRAAEHPTAVELLQNGEQIWTVHEPPPEANQSTPDPDAPNEPHTEPPDESQRIETIGALLKTMRDAATAADHPPEGWDQAVEHTAAATTLPQPMARALLEQANRLRLGGAALGGLVALAARSGEARLAAETLADALGRSPGYGWLRQWDGGSRLTIFRAALLRDRHPDLVRLARNDLAMTLSTGSLSGQLSPTDIRRIVELLAGPAVVSTAWPDIEIYLDEIAPVRNDMPNPPMSTETAPVEAFARWVARYLGHPVRNLDFGARRTLQIINRDYPHIGHSVLADAVNRGGWACEAALLTLIATPGEDRATELSTELEAAVRTAAAGPDGISRDLAGRLAFLYGVEVPEPSHRPLPASYRLMLPPLPERTPPEVDRHGTPHLDMHDPQQLVAPFDLPLRDLAAMAELEPNAVLHRAAAIVKASDARWIQGGHRLLAEYLRNRQQHHTYRPWAYMAGRRALGIVLGELIDADVLPHLPEPPAYYLGLVDETLVGIQPQPVPAWMPLPWRPEGTSSFDVRGWCTETNQAAQAYTQAYSAATPFVLAEYAQWRSLEWNTPEEVRRIYAIHPDAPTNLLVPEKRPWESTDNGAHFYPAHLHLDAGDEELVVHGREARTDAPYIEWLALHPNVGERLGWRHDPHETFAWTGADGRRRARTVLLVRGHLSHPPPRRVACAEVWQVHLSDEGLAELRAAYPTLRRSLTIGRTLSANARNDRPEDETGTCRVPL